MAIAFVQENNTTVSNDGGNFNITFGSTPTNGNAVFVGVIGAASNQTVSSITGTGMTFNNIVTKNTNNYVTMYAALNISGATTTVTVNTSGNPNAFVGFALEFSGIATTAATDKTASNSGNSTTADSGTTATTTQASELWLAFFDSSATGTSFSAPTNGFTLQDQAAAGASIRGGIAYKIVSTTGTANVSVTAGNNFWDGIIATFKAAATAATTNQLMMTGLGS